MGKKVVRKPVKTALGGCGNCQGSHSDKKAFEVLGG